MSAALRLKNESRTCLSSLLRGLGDMEEELSHADIRSRVFYRQLVFIDESVKSRFFEFSQALTACANDGKVVHSDFKSVLVDQVLFELQEKLGWDLFNRRTFLAYYVLMGVVGQVVDSSSVPEVHVVNDPQFFERIECSVNRGEVYFGRFRLHDIHQILGSDVRPRCHQSLQH